MLACIRPSSLSRRSLDWDRYQLGWPGPGEWATFLPFFSLLSSGLWQFVCPQMTKGMPARKFGAARSGLISIPPLLFQQPPGAHWLLNNITPFNHLPKGSPATLFSDIPPFFLGSLPLFYPFFSLLLCPFFSFSPSPFPSSSSVFFFKF